MAAEALAAEALAGGVFVAAFVFAVLLVEDGVFRAVDRVPGADEAPLTEEVRPPRRPSDALSSDALSS
ncbi:hypothetical protein, partial [Frankia casuarinae]|uniref:hypothetical protein n=1 Tax=Frankia casuarinae (strain DSM 45818 / CECT 9043 / HFP020203 / CcI3) TaxID=106370 RepID=UPI0013FD7A44